MAPTPPSSPPTPLAVAVARAASRRGRHAPTVSVPVDVEYSPSTYTPRGSEVLTFPTPPVPPKGPSQSKESNSPYAQPIPQSIQQDSQPSGMNAPYAQRRPSMYAQPTSTQARARVNLDDDDDFYAGPRASSSLSRRPSQTRRMSTFMQKRDLHLPSSVPQYNTRPLALNKARPPPTIDEDAPIPLGKRSDWVRADDSGEPQYNQ